LSGLKSVFDLREKGVAWKDDFVDELVGGFWGLTGKEEEEVVCKIGPAMGIFGVQEVIKSVVVNEEIMEWSTRLFWGREGTEDRVSGRGETERQERVGEDVGEEGEKGLLRRSLG